MAKTEAFDRHLAEYEQWFEDHHYAFLSELEAIRELLPATGRGIEIGVGSGIFAAQLGIEEGCDPSEEMRKKAGSRGIKVKDCIAEKLPYDDNTFDYALLVTTICFVDDPTKTLEEINRTLKPRGELIIGFVDKDSPIGKQYFKIKNKSIFYKDARFFSTEEIHEMLRKNDFITGKTIQTVFGKLEEIKEIQRCKNGYGKGSFVVTRAIKKVDEKLNFALAVDSSDNFESRQFCFAWKFMLYEWKNNEFLKTGEIDNPFRDKKAENMTEMEEKGETLINLLRNNNVTVLVASNFGDNIEKAVLNFIPVIVKSETPSGAQKVMARHIAWLEDELQNRPEDYRLFTIKQGILKTSVHKSNR